MQPVKNPMPQIKHKILVMSGKGGVGKSTVSVNLAYALALSGNKVGIMDVDIHGPSVPKMTGIEGQKIMTGEDQIMHPIEVVTNVFVMSIASLLPHSDAPVVWRGPMKTSLIKQFIEDVKWPELDYLVVDCPPGTGDEPLSVIQMIGKVDGVVIVSTPQDVAFLDARKSVSFCHQMKTPILGIVENMSGFVCPNCNHYIDIFKAGGAERTAKDFQLDILGKIPLESGIVESGDDGKPFVYFHKEGNPAGEVFLSIAEKVALKMNNGETKMSKIAIPVTEDLGLDSVVFNHFGSAPTFLVVDTETQAIRKIDNSDKEHEHGQCNPLQSFVNDKIDAVVTGGIGGGAITKLKAGGVKVFRSGDCKTVAEVLANFAKLEEISPEQGCNHHGHDHGDDHNCAH